jgi:PAS domain S-box-containing protein
MESPDNASRGERAARARRRGGTVLPGGGRRRLWPFRLGTRYIAAYLLATLGIGAGIWAATHSICRHMRDLTLDQCAELAATIAATIPGEEHKLLRTGAEAEGPVYQRLQAHLTAIRQANPDVKRIYTLVRRPGESTWTLVLGADTNPSSSEALGRPYEGGSAPELQSALTHPTAAREPSARDGGRVLSVFAPIRDAEGRAVALVGADLGADEILGPERQFRREAVVFYVLLVIAIGFAGRAHYQKRRVEITRARNVDAQLALHRLAETMTRTRGDVELLQGALDVIATGTGIRHWVYYRHSRDPAALAIVATREIPKEIEEALRPDPPRADAASPASRAAWTREPLLSTDGPPYSPPGAVRIEGLGARPIVACVPIVDAGETTAVLQCFVSRRRGFAPEDLALVRWMASQLAQGLKRRDLERRDQLLASYMLRTGEMLIGTDPAGLVTYLNPAAERALGVRAEELRGIPLDALIQPVESGTGASLVETIHRDGSFTGDLWCVRADGARFPVGVTAAAGQEGAPGRRDIVLLARDVTERRERERQLRAQREAVGMLNERLEHANARLREADRMKNEFIANTSHELRTPLNAVIGFATLLEQGVHHSSEEREAFARWIRESAEHLLGVINDILDLAKIEAGRLQLELEPGDAAEVIRAAVQTMQTSAARKSLALHSSLPEEPLSILMDPARLRQVLLNLLGNAVKFTDTGEVRVRASRDVTGRRVVICIEDTGIGIAKEQQALLFRKFSQVDGSYHRRHQGTGLGLAITRSLMERMNGTIALESGGLGHGTRVTLTFPAHAAAAAPEPAPQGGGHGAADSAPAPDGPAVADRMA